MPAYDGDQSGSPSQNVAGDVPGGIRGNRADAGRLPEPAGWRPADQPLGPGTDYFPFLTAGVPIGGMTTGATGGTIGYHVHMRTPWNEIQPRTPTAAPRPHPRGERTRARPPSTTDRPSRAALRRQSRHSTGMCPVSPADVHGYVDRPTLM